MLSLSVGSPPVKITEPWLGMLVVFLERASALDIAHCRKWVTANEMVLLNTILGSSGLPSHCLPYIVLGVVCMPMVQNSP